MNKRCSIKFVLITFIVYSFGCSKEPNLSGNWRGTATEIRGDKVTTLQLELLLSQNEKNLNGLLTMSLQNNLQQNTIAVQGFLEGDAVSLNGEAGSVLGSSIKINIHGKLNGRRIIGKFSSNICMYPIDCELEKRD
ncbi:hypothetical protein [Melioribacter roseus]|uniref:hypothetical protein n=1 Tax=Melioribacter roseus TaxID=1134405 RepID=UPI00059B6463|nr:hypothetical protein [Melioribacter roseus]